MSKNGYLLLVGIIFLLAGLIHFSRLIAGWPVEIDAWSVPRWVSLFATAIPLYLAWAAFHLRG